MRSTSESTETWRTNTSYYFTEYLIFQVGYSPKYISGPRVSMTTAGVKIRVTFEKKNAIKIENVLNV